MLDGLKLNLIWLIIEQSQESITSELSDTEIVQYLLEKIEAQLLLNTSDRSDTYFYIESRIPLIRDLAELQLFKR